MTFARHLCMRDLELAAQCAFIAGWGEGSTVMGRRAACQFPIAAAAAALTTLVVFSDGLTVALYDANNRPFQQKQQHDRNKSDLLQ